MLHKGYTSAILGFTKIEGARLGIPIITRIILLGSPYFGKLPYRAHLRSSLGSSLPVVAARLLAKCRSRQD